MDLMVSLNWEVAVTKMDSVLDRDLPLDRKSLTYTDKTSYFFPWDYFQNLNLVPFDSPGFPGTRRGAAARWRFWFLGPARRSTAPTPAWLGWSWWWGFCPKSGRCGHFGGEGGSETSVQMEALKQMTKKENIFIVFILYLRVNNP